MPGFRGSSGRAVLIAVILYLSDQISHSGLPSITDGVAFLCDDSTL
jgi:hypothetical protein